MLLGQIDERTTHIQEDIKNILSRFDTIDNKVVDNKETINYIKTNIDHIKIRCPAFNPKIRIDNNGNKTGRIWYPGSWFKKGLFGSGPFLGWAIYYILNNPDKLGVLLQQLGVI